MRAFVLALLVGAGLSTGVACDVCFAAKEAHSQRCSEGVIESCVWVNHYYQAGETCPVE